MSSDVRGMDGADAPGTELTDSQHVSSKRSHGIHIPFYRPQEYLFSSVLSNRTIDFRHRHRRRSHHP
jgi:hypothetical protein